MTQYVATGGSPGSSPGPGLFQAAVRTADASPEGAGPPAGVIETAAGGGPAPKASTSPLGSS
jgi:hypothetical protein